MRTVGRIAVAGALVALGAGVPCLLQLRARFELRTRQSELEQQADRLDLLVRENERLSNVVAQATTPAQLTADQLGELLRLRNERHRLAEQTNLLANLPPDQKQPTGPRASTELSPAERQALLSTEMTQALRRILPLLPPTLQKYSFSNSNQYPDSFSQLEDYFPLLDGQKMIGLRSFDFVRQEGPRPGDALLLEADLGRRLGDNAAVHLYGFADGRVVEVASEDNRFDAWETQHLNSPPAATEDKVYLEAQGTAQERARVTELAAAVGISATDAARFFDRFKQDQDLFGQRLAELETNLTGSQQEKQLRMRAAAQEELSRIATETLGDKGSALVQKLMTDGK